MTKVVKEHLLACGWYEGRDVSSNFTFSEEKELFQKAIHIMREFGYLKISQRDINGDNFIFMDIDDSEASKVLRRDLHEIYYQYNDYYQTNPEEFQYSEALMLEDIHMTQSAIQSAGRSLIRIGCIDTLDAYIIHLYMDVEGGIWIGGNHVRFYATDFIDCLNKAITGELPFRKNSIAWYNKKN